MRKNILLAGMALVALPSLAVATNSDDYLKQQINAYFSDIYEKVDVVSEGGQSKVVFPEIKTFKDTENGKTEAKPIASYSATLTETVPFRNHKQYSMKFTDLERVYGFLYSKFDIADFSSFGDLKVGKYLEEINYVPELSATTQHNFMVENLVLSQKDEESGLSSDIAGVREVKVNSSFADKSDHIEYRINNLIKGGRVNLSLVEISLPMLWSEGVHKYDKTSANFAEMLQDLTMAQDVRYNLKVTNASFGIMGMKANMDIETKSAAVRHDDTQTFDIKSDVVVSNIKQNISKEVDLKKLRFAYILKGLKVESIKNYVEMQNKLQKASEINDGNISEEQVAALQAEIEKSTDALVKDMMDGWGLQSKISADFAPNTSFSSWINIRSEQNFALGEVHLTFNNINKVLPAPMCDEKMLKDPNYAEICAASDPFMGLRNLLKTAEVKKMPNGDEVHKVVLTLSKDGVFCGKEKISEAVDLRQYAQDVTTQLSDQYSVTGM